MRARMIAIEQREQRGAIVREKRQAAVQRGSSSKSSASMNTRIAQPVLAGPHVRDVAGVERAHAAIASALRRCAEIDAAGLVGDAPRPPHAAKLLGDSKARLQAIFVKARAEVRAAEPGVAHALQRPELLLRADRGGVEQRVIVVRLVEDRALRAASCAD